MLADLSVVQRRLDRIGNDLKKGKKELLPEQAVLERALALLEQEQPLSRLDLAETEAKLIRGIQFLTLKPVIVLANVGESQVGEEPPAALVAHAASRGFETVAFCAQVEAEIAGLDDDEQRAFLEDFGIDQPAREKVIRTCYHSLDLLSFLTAGGKDEVRLDHPPRQHRPGSRRGDPLRHRPRVHPRRDRGFRRPRPTRQLRRLPRGRRAAFGGQGVPRAGRRRDHLPFQRLSRPQTVASGRAGDLLPTTARLTQMTPG